MVKEVHLPEAAGRCERRRVGWEAQVEGDRLEAEQRDAAGFGPGAAEREQDLAVVGEREALVGEGGPQAVAAELLEAQAMVGVDGGVGMHGEAVHRGLAPAGPDSGLLTLGRSVLGRWLGQRGHVLHALANGPLQHVGLGRLERGKASLQQSGDPAGQPLGQAQDVLVARRRQPDEAEGALLLVENEDAVGQQRMGMDVAVQGATETLYEHHRGVLGGAQALAPSLPALPGEDDTHGDAQHRCLASGWVWMSL